MCKYARWVSIPLFSLLLIGCGLLPGVGPAPTEGEVLPTTTPEPVAETPVPTETLLPPPTVTPFPSVTPEGGIPEETAEETEGEATGEETAGEASTGGEAPAQPEAAPAALPGIPSEVPLGQRLYFADFTSGAWYATETDTLTMEQALGGYLWQVGPLDAAWLNTGTLDLIDFYAQIKVNVQRCPQDANYGLRFRLVDDETYYAYLVWCNDTYSVGSESAETSEHGTIISRTELPSSLAGKAESERVLGILAQGSQFTLYLDGAEVASFEEAEHVSGDLAMWARAGESVLRLVWDDLEVYELK